MQASERRLQRERTTIAVMIALYCRHHHGGRKRLCDTCAGLAAYAQQRLDKCPFAESKPTCVKCPIHCYKPACREQIREVMKYAGPRLLLRRPILTIRHLIDERQPPPDLKEARQHERSKAAS